MRRNELSHHGLEGVGDFDASAAPQIRMVLSYDIEMVLDPSDENGCLLLLYRRTDRLAVSCVTNSGIKLDSSIADEPSPTNAQYP